MSYEYKLTILTPTFNRRDKLVYLIESLKRQTKKQFQWLVIDDGSTDNTTELFENIKIDDVYIEYKYKENGGKHTALNYAHEFLKGEYVCIVDSDDFLTDNAVSEIYETIEKYGDNDKIGCISFLRGYDNNTSIVKGFPKDTVVSNHIEFRLNNNLLGDCCEVVRSGLLKEYPFPVFKNEKFISEGYLWVNLALCYDTVYVNKIIYICEYLDGGLTKSGRRMRLKCPCGGMTTSNTFLRADKLNFRLTIKQLMLYTCYGKLAGHSFEYLYNNCNRKNMFCMTYLLGLGLYKYWKLTYNCRVGGE